MEGLPPRDDCNFCADCPSKGFLERWKTIFRCGFQYRGPECSGPVDQGSQTVGNEQGRWTIQLRTCGKEEVPPDL